MKVVQINAVSGVGSTGKIVEDISSILNQKNIVNYILYSYGNTNHKQSIKYMSNFEVKVGALKSKILGNYGLNYKIPTKRLIKLLDKINPDIVHIHNIHGHNLHLEIFFKYLKSKNIKVIWTFHDCWAFTGYCTYFDYINCNKWKESCQNCPQKRAYSWLFDKSSRLYDIKKELFTAIENMTIITPSKWLADLAGQSFLAKKQIKVINNGIDLEIFKPAISNFRYKYGLQNKTVILSVALGFEERKGFKYFLQLSKIVDKNIKIVLVGVTSEQIKNLPENIIGIEKTNNQKELAEIYTAADIFINCTLEDNFPTVNIEALACGTPVITFNTGGSIESVDNNTGVIITKGDIYSLNDAINNFDYERYNTAECIKRAKQCYEKNMKYTEYIDLYKEEHLI